MDSVLSNEVARRIAADLTTLVSEAEKHGTLPRIKSVAFYFNETELRTIIKLLRSCHGILDPAQGSPEPDAWLVQWFRANGDAGSNVYVKEDDARRAAANLEKYSSSETTAGVTPLYAAQPPAAPVETASTKRMLQIAEEIEDSYQCTIVRDLFLDEADRRLIVDALHAAAAPDRPKCKLCGLEDGACICAHLPPQRSSAATGNDEVAAKLINQYLGMSDIDAEDAAYFRAVLRDTEPQQSAATVQEFEDELDEAGCLALTDDGLELFRHIARKYILTEPQGAGK